MTGPVSRGMGTLLGAIRPLEVPGWLRVSLTANDQMVERAIPHFGAALAEAAG